RLSALGLRVKTDDSDNSPGWKFAQYEMKGVPVRIEIGPRDIEAGKCVIGTRHNLEKSDASLEGIVETVKEKLEEVRAGLYEIAIENRKKHTYDCTTIDEINEAIEKNGDGFVRAMWCGEEECEDGVKAATGVGSRCIPFEQENISDKCVCCGKPAKKLVYWGKAY
ncbi:MAG: proline--tRNA ligase, partial [Clostridia bacterium]|nr:proline--tRNA ligase [Clostridia bacterium]